MSDTGLSTNQVDVDTFHMGDDDRICMSYKSLMSGVLNYNVKPKQTRSDVNHGPDFQV